MDDTGKVKTKIKKTRKIKSIFVGFVSVPILSLFFIELTVRIFPQLPLALLSGHYLVSIIAFNFEPLKKYTREKGAIMYDETFGYTLKPESRISFQTPDYKVEYHFHSLSLPSGKVIGVNDNPGEPIFAIAVGDSFTFCSGVPQEKCWTEILESKLSREVLNLGVFGYGTVQKYLVLKEAVKLKPKIIIFQYGAGDGVDDKYFLSGKAYPIPHPQNLFRKTDNIFLRESFVIASIYAIHFLYKFPQNIMESYYLNYEDTIKIEIDYLKKVIDISLEKGIELFLLFVPREQSIENEICRYAKCIRPEFKKYHFFKNDPHLNEEGNRFLADEVFENLVRYSKILKDSAK